MGWWQVNADTLAGCRFVVSPLAETTAGLQCLERGTTANPGERAWLDAHLPAYRERLADDPVTALLIRVGLGSNWNADFLTPTPRGERYPMFAEELARIRETPGDCALADLSVSLGGPIPAPLQRFDLPERAAELMEWVWAKAVQRYWPRRRRIIEADIIARTEQLSSGGWAAALGNMRPGMRWLGEGRLQVNAHDNPPRQLSGAQMFFVPVTPRREVRSPGRLRTGMPWCTRAPVR